MCGKWDICLLRPTLREIWSDRPNSISVSMLISLVITIIIIWLSSSTSIPPRGYHNPLSIKGSGMSTSQWPSHENFNIIMQTTGAAGHQSRFVATFQAILSFTPLGWYLGILGRPFPCVCAPPPPKFLDETLLAARWSSTSLPQPAGPLTAVLEIPMEVH
jgi:hypothetical protein